jgi:hypothetical protein
MRMRVWLPLMLLGAAMLAAAFWLWLAWVTLD